MTHTKELAAWPETPRCLSENKRLWKGFTLLPSYSIFSEPEVPVSLPWSPPSREGVGNWDRNSGEG